ncbi:MAG: helix-turn-helix transcriptional regulator [Oscillospiraceae bacterium]|nr:helix-turn-helix transcriptional regulator [Oscillospiraceae bacterium]MBR2422039.1 helix-turn-helix transcriptional regulator [Oscillospiraceae bacterium]
MGTLYDNIMALCESRGIKGGKMCSDIGISKGLLTDLKMGRRTGVSAVTAQKIASYFGVSVGYLLGEEAEKAPANNSRRDVSDEDIMFALFGGNGEITDEMYEEVKNFARFVAQREESKKNKK